MRIFGIALILLGVAGLVAVDGESDRSRCFSIPECHVLEKPVCVCSDIYARSCHWECTR